MAEWVPLVVGYFIQIVLKTKAFQNPKLLTPQMVELHYRFIPHVNPLIQGHFENI